MTCTAAYQYGHTARSGQEKQALSYAPTIVQLGKKAQEAQDVPEPLVMLFSGGHPTYQHRPFVKHHLEDLVHFTAAEQNDR